MLVITVVYIVAKIYSKKRWPITT